MLFRVEVTVNGRFPRVSLKGCGKPARMRCSLCQIVGWSAAALWRHPVDHFIRIHNVAGFTVHTIRRVNLKTPAAWYVDHLVNGGGTKPLAWVAVFRSTARMTDI